MIYCPCISAGIPIARATHASCVRVVFFFHASVPRRQYTSIAVAARVKGCDFPARFRNDAHGREIRGYARRLDGPVGNFAGRLFGPPRVEECLSHAHTLSSLVCLYTYTCVRARARVAIAVFAYRRACSYTNEIFHNGVSERSGRAPVSRTPP